MAIADGAQYGEQSLEEGPATPHSRDRVQILYRGVVRVIFCNLNFKPYPKEPKKKTKGRRADRKRTDPGELGRLGKNRYARASGGDGRGRATQLFFFPFWRSIAQPVSAYPLRERGKRKDEIREWRRQGHGTMRAQGGRGEEPTRDKYRRLTHLAL